MDDNTQRESLFAQINERVDDTLNFIETLNEDKNMKTREVNFVDNLKQVLIKFRKYRGAIPLRNELHQITAEYDKFEGDTDYFLLTPLKTKFGNKSLFDFIEEIYEALDNYDDRLQNMSDI